VETDVLQRSRQAQLHQVAADNYLERRPRQLTPLSRALAMTRRMPVCLGIESASLGIAYGPSRLRD
jgi:hypothetical protein